MTLVLAWLGKNPLSALLLAALLAVGAFAGIEAVGRAADKHALVSAQAALADKTAALATATR
jgi:hypothetical protein